MEILQLIVAVTLLMILLLAAIWLKVFDLLYEEIATNPLLFKTLPVVGESVYGIGLSVTAASVYSYLDKASFDVTILIYGIILILSGAKYRK